MVPVKMTGKVVSGIFLTIVTLLFSQTSLLAAVIVIVQSSDIEPYQDVGEVIMQELASWQNGCAVKRGEKFDYKKIVLNSSRRNMVWERHILEEKPTLLVAIGTRALKICSRLTDTPIVYSLVPKPQNLIKGRKNVTGISMSVTPFRYLQKLNQNFPHIQRIGLPYNPQERDSLNYYQKAKSAADLLGYELVALPVNSPECLIRELGFKRMVLDALWMWPDPSLVTRQSTVALLKYSLRNHILLMTFAHKYMKQGAGFAVVVENREIGQSAATLAIDIVTGGGVAVSRSREIIPPRARVYKNLQVLASCEKSTVGGAL